jgi:hypothetical protein
LTHIHTRPIYIRKGKKKRRRYSRGTKVWQQSALSGTKLMRRLTGAWSDGFRVYNKRADRSSRKKRDGFLKDMFKNSAKGLSKTIRVTSKTPKDFVKVVYPKAARRQGRRFFRAFRLW